MPWSNRSCSYLVNLFLNQEKHVNTLDDQQNIHSAWIYAGVNFWINKEKTLTKLKKMYDDKKLSHKNRFDTIRITIWQENNGNVNEERLQNEKLQTRLLTYRYMNIKENTQMKIWNRCFPFNHLDVEIQDLNFKWFKRFEGSHASRSLFHQRIYGWSNNTWGDIW